MALQAYVENLEQVGEEHRALYVANESGGFRLDADGVEDLGPLKRSIEHESGKRKRAESELQEVQTQIAQRTREAEEAAAATAARSREETEGNWQKKLTEDVAAKDAEYKPRVERQAGFIARMATSNAAREIASRIGVKGSQEPLAQLIGAQIKVDVTDGGYTVRYFSSTGIETTLANLETELRGNPAIAPLIHGAVRDRAAHAKRIGETLGRPH
jgi:hypothetical protein